MAPIHVHAIEHALNLVYYAMLIIIVVINYHNKR